jgi:hypothetical protein
MFLRAIPLFLLLARATDTDSPVIAARREIQRLIRVLPVWEKDKLAQYEQPELAAVRGDLIECLTDSTDDELLLDFLKLKADADALQVLDDLLNKTDVI